MTAALTFAGIWLLIAALILWAFAADEWSNRPPVD